MLRWPEIAAVEISGYYKERKARIISGVIKIGMKLLNQNRPNGKLANNIIFNRILMPVLTAGNQCQARA